MNLILFYDKETTGLPLWKEPSEDPKQPHIVECAALLVDAETRKTVSSMSVVIRPDGWEIPAEVSAVHGITTEVASKVGIDEATALDVFLDLHSRAQVRVAFNESFDARIVRIAMKRFGFNDEDADKYKDAPAQCAMRMASPLVGLGKFPNLGEAYQHFFSKPLEGAHSALIDAQACRDIYFALLDAGYVGNVAKTGS